MRSGLGLLLSSRVFWRKAVFFCSSSNSFRTRRSSCCRTILSFVSFNTCGRNISRSGVLLHKWSSAWYRSISSVTLVSCRLALYLLHFTANICSNRRRQVEHPFLGSFITLQLKIFNTTRVPSLHQYLCVSSLRGWFTLWFIFLCEKTSAGGLIYTASTQYLTQSIINLKNQNLVWFWWLIKGTLRFWQKFTWHRLIIPWHRAS